ncbi:MAG: PD-(D/E)XK nuclease family protein, partial [Candidatus Berkiellales bacterium]
MDIELVKHLKEAATILTPTRRLAMRLKYEANDYFSQKAKVWHTPSIYALADWFKALWEQFEIQGEVTAQLLSTTQSLLRWEEIIQFSLSGKALLQPYATAKTAFAAWASLHDWLALDQLNIKVDNIDHIAFQAWAKEYQAWQHKNQAIDEAQLPNTLLDLLLKDKCNKTVVLYGFEEFSPLLNLFFEKCQQKGWQITRLDPTPIQPERRVVHAFPQELQEWQAAALWAKDLLLHDKTNIAILTPHLTDQRNQIERVFNDILDPLHICQPAKEVDRFVNISTAIPLLQYPIIAAAMAILTAEWRSLKGGEKNKVPSYQQFGHACFQILKNKNWPGERSLNSVEHQVVKRWYALLNELSFCDKVLAPSSYRAALDTLAKLAANVPFQAENKSAPIQILGLLEAAGQHFDYLWIMGLYNEAWPNSAQPNPFLSISFQRQHQMPHASAEREMFYALKMTQRLQQSAQEVIFSYPTEKQGRMLEVSELLKELPQEPFSAPDHSLRCEALFDDKRVLETFQDHQGPAISPDEKITGNSATLAYQAACPFKAFAVFRLNARQVITRDLWLQADQLGTLIHTILEQLWQELKDQKSLLQLGDEGLAAKLEGLIAKNVSDIMSLSTLQNSPYLEVEKLRLKHLLQDYLQLEKNRQPFEVIAIESEREFTLAKVNFKLRLDRIDKTNQNDIIIIDYKTGKFNIADLSG